MRGNSAERRSRARRSREPSSQSFSLAGLISQVVLTAAIVIAPWLFGGVQTTVQFWLFVAVIVALVAWWMHESRSAQQRSALPLALVPLLLALGLGLFQLLSLSPQVHAWVSPHGAQLWQELDGNSASRPATLFPAATRHVLALLLLAVTVFYLGSRLFRSSKAQIVVCAILAINGAAFAFFGLVQQLTWNGMLYGKVPLSQGGTPFAAFVNKNNAGGFLNLSLAAAVGLAIWLAIRGQTSQQGSASGERASEANIPVPHQNRLLGFLAGLSAGRVTAICLVGLIAAGILCSMSRGAVVAMIGAALVTMLAMLLTRPRSLRWWMMGGAVAAGLAVVGWVGMSGAVQSRLETLQSERVLAEGRIPHWRDGLQAVPDFWRAGSGLGTYGYVYRSYQQRLDNVWFKHAENQYLEAAVEAGLPGLVLMLSAIALVGWSAWRLMKSNASSRTYAVGVAGLFALTSQSIHAFFDFGLYLPANALLLALLCGMVTGRAARLAEAPRVPRLVAMPRLGVLANALGAVFLVAGVLSANEIQRAAAVDAAVKQAPLAEAHPPVSANSLREAQERLSLAVQSRPDDAEAQLHLARLLIHKYRLSELERLRSDENYSGLTDARLWQLTSPVALQAQVHYLSGQGQVEELQRLRGQPSILENLRSAHAHLVAARHGCPLIPRVHLALAELSAVVADAEEESSSVQRARRLAPSNPDILFTCGLLDMQAGRQERACEFWKQCLALSDRHLTSILPLANHYLRSSDAIAELLPNSPELLIRLAAYGERKVQDENVRQAAVQRAQQLADGNEIAEDQRRYLRGSLLAIEQDYGEAIEQYEAAVDLRPEEVTWRYELALLLKDQGRLDEAHEHARICARREPKNKQYLTLLREIHRQRLTTHGGEPQAETIQQGAWLEKGAGTFCRNGPPGAAHKRFLSPVPARGKKQDAQDLGLARRVVG